MRVSLLAACLSACLASVSAFADPLSESLSPTLTLGLQFGDRAALRADSLRWTALFDVRSPLRADPELKRGALSPGQSVDFTSLSPQVPLLTVFQLGATPKGLDLARVLGHDMLTSNDQLDETGDSSSGSRHAWIWWTAGAIAVGSIVGLATQHHNDQAQSGNPNPGPIPPNCSVISVGGVCVR